MLKKQAKVLGDQQIKAVLKYLESCPRNALRNQVMFLLSIHGLRAKEIAELQVGMIVDSEGQIADVISLQDKASKGSSGRVIPMNKILRGLLVQLARSRIHCLSDYLIQTERTQKFSANTIAVFFKRLYTKLGFVGCSSHSGRRTFITNCARRTSTVGGSLRDVMALVGHKNLGTTQRYVDENAEAQKALVEVIYSSLKCKRP